FCFQAEDGIRGPLVTGVQTCALPISASTSSGCRAPTDRRRVPLYLEDFAPGQVRESPPRTLTKDEIVAFAREYDPQPFHTDEERSEERRVGKEWRARWWYND